MTLTTVILTKNNQETLSRALKSVSFSDEIIVIDDNSSDNTIEIVKKHKAAVISHPLENDWSKARNLGLSNATSEWVFFLDSDEEVTQDLQREIKQATSSPNYSGYFLKRQDSFLGTALKHGETSNVKLLRLAKKSAGKWHHPVHEVWRIKGKTKTLKHPLLHQRNINLTDFTTRINLYTDLHAKESKKFNYHDLFKPIVKFIYNYIILLGFLDGFPGLVMAYYMSLHSLTVRIKIWENTNR